MRRWKLTIEYDGGDFVGWQSQISGNSVQDVIERAIFKLSGENARLHVAGRTDSGVHALGQVAHFDLEKDFKDYEVRNALNVHMMPHKVSILKAEKVSDEFHARFGAQKRTYRYIILNRQAPTAIGREYVWHVRKALDVDRMRQGAQYLLGHHDFTSFRDAECQAKSPDRTLDVLNITRDGDRIYVDVEAKSFLHHQVRNIVGTLKRVGDGSWEPIKVKEILEARDRRVAGPTAPAQGLFFVSVHYDEIGSK